MVAIAAKGRAAIVLTREEELLLTNIVHLSDDEAAAKRAMVLILAWQGKTYNDITRCTEISEVVISRIKKQWANNDLSGSEKVNAVCFSKSGRRKNKEAMAQKASNILQFNKRISPELSQNARSLAIVEMAKQEGIKLSQSTVIRFLREDQKVSS
ncbi:MAG: hypothetical protein HC815_05575 [Richelia sp. RM1_1_1]|nr:hypothetical protein [Richelia sp. RM1_1_1]